MASAKAPTRPAPKAAARPTPAKAPVKTAAPTAVKQAPKAPVKAAQASPAPRPAAAPPRPAATPPTAPKPSAGPVKQPPGGPVKPVQGKPGTTAAKGAPATGAPKEKKASPIGRRSATEQEVADAIAGNLKPREKIGQADQEALRKQTASGRASGRPLGVTTGLPIQMAWCYVFQENFKAPAKPAQVGADGIAKLGSGKLTDKQITAWMMAEFPGRTTSTFKQVQGVRRAYNNGVGFNYTKPKIQSIAYGDDGKQAPPSLRGFAKKNAENAANKPAATVEEVDDQTDEVEAGEGEDAGVEEAEDTEAQGDEVSEEEEDDRAYNRRRSRDAGTDDEEEVAEDAGVEEAEDTEEEPAADEEYEEVEEEVEE